MSITPANTGRFREMNDIRKLKQSEENMKKVIKMTSAKYSIAKQEAKQGTDNPDDCITCESPHECRLSLTHQLIQCLSDNLERAPQGRRYKNLENYFTLLSFMGPHYYGLLHTTFLFPSYRTVQLYRNRIFDEIAPIESIFDGEIQNIMTIIEKCLPSDFNSKTILAIDAAYVTPYVSVHCDGTVSGLIEPQTICPHVANLLIESEKNFSTFISSHHQNLISAVFVLMLIPIDASHRAIPIFCIPAKHGTATITIREHVVSIIDFLLNHHIQIVGLASDGDHQYSSFSKDFMKFLFNDIHVKSEMMVTKLLNNFGKICHFSDPFHLVKRDRYRKVSKQSFIVDPWNQRSLYSVKDLMQLGIPDYILDAEQARKMEDSLPLKLFSKTVLGLILDRDDPKLFFAMLPSTLLMESIHSESLSREQRIDHLMIGASLMILYEFYKKYIKKSIAMSKGTDLHSIPNKYHCFTTEWSNQYIMLALSIVALLYTESTVNLGSCGTHILEHYFGSIRRHSGGDNTHERFMKSMKKVFIEQYLLNAFKIPREHPHRRSDSGFNVCDEIIEEKNNLMHYLQIARGLLETVLAIPGDIPVYHFAMPESPITIRMLSERYLTIEKKIHRFSSTKVTGITATGGFNNCRIWSAINQVSNLAKEGH